MPTDDERRAVASRLREFSGKEFHLGRLCAACGIDKSSLMSRVTTADAAAWSRLADLIDPGVTDASATPHRHHCDVSATCDRDALLALADEFDGKADHIASCIESMDGDFDMHAVEAEAEQREYARRIREACGEAAS